VTGGRRIPVAFNATALLSPLTGVGHYARSLATPPVLVVGRLTCAGVWDSGALSATLANQVGPCDGVSGQSVF